MKFTIKAQLLVYTAALLFTNSIAQTKPGFTLTGTIKGVRAGKAVLTSFNEAERTTEGVDSVVFKNGAFTLKGNVSTPEMMTLQIKPGNWTVKVFVENSTIKLIGDTAGSVHYNYNSYGKGAELKRVKITGSKNQEQYDAYENAPEQLKAKQEFVLIEKQLAVEKNPEKRKELKLKNAALAESLKAWKVKWISDFTGSNPSSTAVAYVFAEYHRFDYEMTLNEFETIVNKFSGEAKHSVYYTNLAKELKAKKALLPGNIAPDFTLLQRDSTQLSLSSTRGKYVLIDFWASWCHPCRAAIPHWKEVYQKYQSKGFEILSVSGDSRWMDWTKAMDIEKMPWPQVVDKFPGNNMPSVVGATYQTTFIPFYVLLDKEGKILVYSGDEKEVEKKLEEVLQ